jgi:sec-independent protein translocase protein TatC
MKRDYDDDLFKDTTMTFGEHLEELRTCLFRALLGLMVGFGIGLYLSNTVVGFIKHPLEDALGNYYTSGAVREYTKLAAIWEAEGRQLPYTLQQIEEAVDRGLIFEVRYVHEPTAGSAVAAVPVSAAATDEPSDAGDGGSPADGASQQAPLDEQLKPLLLWQRVEDDNRISIRTLSAQEAFTIWIKAGFITGFVLASPWMFYQIWTFVAAGLYPHEKKYVHVFLPFSIGLFLTGAAVAYFFVFQFVLKFLLDFNVWLGLDPDPRISEWLSFVLFLPLGFGLGFQLPLVMLFLERIGIFDVPAYWEKWKIAVMAIVILAAVLTPADPYSMLLLGGPMVLLYFLGIALCTWWPRPQPEPL